MIYKMQKHVSGNLLGKENGPLKAERVLREASLSGDVLIDCNSQSSLGE